MTPRILIRVGAVAALASLFTACSDGGGPAHLGPPATLTPSSTTTINGLANTDVTSPITISVKDAAGHALPNTEVTFAVTAGGGSLTVLKDTTDANGQVPLPTWRFGKSAEPQVITASAGTGTDAVSVNIQGTVTTAYKIEVRFFGTPMTADQQALFTKAAQRIMGIVTGDVIDADATGQNFDLATACNVSGQPPFNELVDDIIIYASIRDIDGPGKILAQAGPCLTRDAGTPQNPMPMPAVGDMSFDAADIAAVTGAGSLQEVITHEMMHVLGFGVFWDDRGDLQGAGTADPRFTGPAAVQACKDVGGTINCAVSVPVENTGGSGTADSHWRESVFGNELMTGFIDHSPNPLSKVTVGSLADLGYVVNNADFDTFQLPLGSLRAAGSTSMIPSMAMHQQWEQLPRTTVYQLTNGRIVARRIR
ncbi:MAG TPA: leishmanolysin-related zinc metalloendopeptidase [Gemmatimonadaceae bacterium]|nr:leishmanolysin-related zinc metalloendopeptidase [Gemmatimonadaceae bacterium]